VMTFGFTTRQRRSFTCDDEPFLPMSSTAGRSPALRGGHHAGLRRA
jgi:hypothetical protein